VYLVIFDISAVKGKWFDEEEEEEEEEDEEEVVCEVVGE
jgi:hypothetical protein